MADLTKYAKGKRMVQEDKIKQIEQNKADIDALKGQVEEIPIVEANPVLEGTEANLEGLQVGETKYKVPQPTEVVANPTLAGTETNLEGLQVGETKYKVGGGAELYRHTINIYSSSAVECCFVLYTTTSKAFDLSTLATYMYNNGINSQYNEINAGGSFTSTNVAFNSINNIFAIYAEQPTYLTFRYNKVTISVDSSQTVTYTKTINVYNSNNLGITTIRDTVTKIL